jgi:hypothetical protein
VCEYWRSCCIFEREIEKKDLNVESAGSYGGRVKRMTVANILIL